MMNTSIFIIQRAMLIIKRKNVKYEDMSTLNIENIKFNNFLNSKLVTYWSFWGVLKFIFFFNRYRWVTKINKFQIICSYKN